MSPALTGGTVTTSTYDMFLVLHPFRDNVREFHVLAAPFATLSTRHVHSVEGYYAPRIDTALIALRFNHLLLERWGHDAVHTFAARSGLPMVVPQQLTARARRRFFLRHLSGYSTYVQNYPSTATTEPLVPGVIQSLCDHLDSEPVVLNPSALDMDSELPLFDGRRRFASVWG